MSSHRISILVFVFLTAIPGVAWYIEKAGPYALRFDELLDVLSFVLLVLVPFLLLWMVSLGLVGGLAILARLVLERYQERKRLADPVYQFGLLVDEIEACNNAIVSMLHESNVAFQGQGDPGVVSNRAAIREQMTELETRLWKLGIETPKVVTTNYISPLSQAYGPWMQLLPRLERQARRGNLGAAQNLIYE